jgi:hypothetical protein
MQYFALCLARSEAKVESRYNPPGLPQTGQLLTGLDSEKSRSAWNMRLARPVLWPSLHL